jgi:hypothetical protein
MDVGNLRNADVVLPLCITRYSFYKRLGGPQGRSEQVQEISPPLEFDRLTVASRYTD